MRMVLYAASLLAMTGQAARADALDDGWRYCQSMRESTMVNGRFAFGDYQAAVREDCNKIAAQMAARPPPAYPSQQDVDAVAKAAIAKATGR
jgi:hypothetical protein